MAPAWLRAQILRNYLQRNFEQMTSKQSTVDAYRNYLQTITLTTKSSINELEAIRLTQLGFTGNSLFDQWRQFMNSEGYGGKSMGDALRSYFSRGEVSGVDDPTFDTGEKTGNPIGLLLTLTYA